VEDASAMQVPVEIAFHNIQKSDWAEEEIRSRVAKLEKIYDRLTACRVRVDQRANSSNRSIPPVVRIEMSVPGYKDIVVSHEPDHLQLKYQTPDLHNAINEAFRIAEDRLAEFKRWREDRDRVPQHDHEMQFLGQVADIDPNGEFGFLMTKEGALLYFHRNSIIMGEFDKLRRGDEVHYVEEMGDTGPIASKVRVKSNH
jgi:cold shock CspA family protein/ribosome-associated translation inhibitor RaiA